MSSKVRWLEFTSTFNGIDSFQCESCGHVWTAPAGEGPPQEAKTVSN
jgi:hypothetical protein